MYWCDYDKKEYVVSMNRVLVTGGAGFLGSHVCAALMKSSDSFVTAVDDLSTGKMENLAPLIGQNRFEFLQWDVRQPFDRPVDQIYHAACPASPRAYQLSPTGTRPLTFQATRPFST